MMISDVSLSPVEDERPPRLTVYGTVAACKHRIRAGDTTLGSDNTGRSTATSNKVIIGMIPDPEPAPDILEVRERPLDLFPLFALVAVNNSASNSLIFKGEKFGLFS